MYHFIISSATSLDRRESMRNQFERLQLPEPIFFNAIMGNELSPEELTSKVDPSCTLSLGEIGCGLSHLAIYKTLLASDEPSVFIFEDDIILSDAVNLNLLLTAQRFVNEQKAPTVLLLRPARFMLDKVKDLNDTLSIMKVNEINSGYAYIINRSAAENIIKLQAPLKFIIDGWRYYTLLNTLQAFCLNDYILAHNFDVPSIISSLDKPDSRTTISKERVALKAIIESLPKEEQKRIKKEKWRRTFQRIKCILSGRKDMNFVPKK